MMMRRWTTVFYFSVRKLCCRDDDVNVILMQWCFTFFCFSVRKFCCCVSREGCRSAGASGSAKNIELMTQFPFHYNIWYNWLLLIAYLIFIIFFRLADFKAWKSYTQKCVNSRQKLSCDKTALITWAEQNFTLRLKLHTVRINYTLREVTYCV